MGCGEHEQRASKPAPRRYGSEANPFRAALPNQDTPEAMTGRLSGELLAETSLNCPPAQSSASGGLLGRVWQGVQYRDPLPARAYLAAGMSLRDVASILSKTPEELDLALWNSLGETRA